MAGFAAMTGLTNPARAARPKVAHVVWRGGFGGMTRALFQLIRAQWENSEYEPALIVANGESAYFDELRELGVGVRVTGLRSDRQLVEAPRISACFRGFPIHHFHAAEVTLTAASLLARGSARVFTYRAGGGPKSGARQLRYAFAGWALRRHFHAFAGNTKHACAAGSRMFGVPAERWVPVYNGLEFSLHEARSTRAEARQAYGLSEGTFSIGTAADLRDWKRVDRLIDAFSELDEPNARLLILGDGPSRTVLEDRARVRGVAGSTVFTGRLRSIADALSALDAFVLPSNYRESFGNAAVEAMYHRLPVVVFEDSGGLREHVIDGQTGFVVASVEQLTERLRVLKSDSALRSRIGAAAHEFVTSRYTIPRMVAAYDELYRAAERRAGRR